jgi:hypothetical protein
MTTPSPYPTALILKGQSHVYTHLHVHQIPVWAYFLFPFLGQLIGIICEVTIRTHKMDDLSSCPNVHLQQYYLLTLDPSLACSQGGGLGTLPHGTHPGASGTGHQASRPKKSSLHLLMPRGAREAGITHAPLLSTQPTAVF